MKKPKTFKKLFELVHPEDLLHVINFCGVNDHRDEEHSKTKQELSDKLYQSIFYKSFASSEKDLHSKEPKYLSTLMTDEYYDSIVKCLQDFYYWGHQFDHIWGHIFQRVMNALEIPLVIVRKVHDMIKVEKARNTK